jgi:hypothetical protein
MSVLGARQQAGLEVSGELREAARREIEDVTGWQLTASSSAAG